jgi:hypothetical protein
VLIDGEWGRVSNDGEWGMVECEEDEEGWVNQWVKGKMKTGRVYQLFPAQILVFFFFLSEIPNAMPYNSV